MGVVEVLDPVQPARAGGWKVDVGQGERNGRVASEWFNRPDDERYLSLDDLWANVKSRSERSRSRVVQTADIRVEAARDTRWKVPGVLDWSTGVYNPDVEISRDTTTLYASDRDVFLFLVDDRNPIEAGKLADGSPDLYFRGFYCWNSEVGAKTLGMASFYLRAVAVSRRWRFLHATSGRSASTQRGRFPMTVSNTRCWSMLSAPSSAAFMMPMPRLSPSSTTT